MTTNGKTPEEFVVHFDTFVKDVETSQPWVLKAGDTTVRIYKPNARQMLQLGKESVSRDLDESLKVICGDSYQDLMDVAGDYDLDVLSSILESIQNHFFGNAPLETSSGSSTVTAPS